MSRVALLGLALLLTLGLFAVNPYDGLSKDQIAQRHFGGATRSSVSNDFVTAYCSDYNGSFTIGTSGENPQSLLFGFPSEGSTSHTIFNVDGTLYANDWVDGTTNIEANSSSVQDNSIVTSFVINGVTINQILTPVAGDSYGAIRIGYTAVATDGQTHQMGILLELDTMVNSNDAAPLSTSFGIINVESQFSFPNIPIYWHAFESENYDPSYLVAEGLLQGSDTRTPDIFWLGSWGNLTGVSWDYTPDGEEYYDSAVIYRWNPIAVGTTPVSYSTYFGTGTATSQTGDLTLVVSAPSELMDVFGFLTPDPFDINLIALNTTSSVATNVSATLQLPQGLQLLYGNATQSLTPSTIPGNMVGTASWIVMALNPATDQTYQYTISVTADGVDDNSVQMSIFVPHTEFGVGTEDSTIPKPSANITNYPNPFNPSTTVAFDLAEAGNAELVIYNVKGQMIRTLVSEMMSAGNHTVNWDGNDDTKKPVASGIYLARLVVDGKQQTRKMLLVK